MQGTHAQKRTQIESSKCGLKSLNFTCRQNRKMNAKTHTDLIRYLKHGTFPKEFTSSKSNFVKLVGKHTLNGEGVLLRNGKRVVKKSERKQIYEGKFSVQKTRLSVSPRAFWQGCDLEQNQEALPLAWREKLRCESRGVLHSVRAQAFWKLARTNAQMQANSDRAKNDVAHSR